MWFSDFKFTWNRSLFVHDYRDVGSILHLIEVYRQNGWIERMESKLHSPSSWSLSSHPGTFPLFFCLLLTLCSPHLKSVWSNEDWRLVDTLVPTTLFLSLPLSMGQIGKSGVVHSTWVLRANHSGMSYYFLLTSLTSLHSLFTSLFYHFFPHQILFPFQISSSKQYIFFFPTLSPTSTHFVLIWLSILHKVFTTFLL